MAEATERASLERVLLVEDRPALREVLGRALQRAFEVEAVGDGDLALERLQAGGWAVLVSDVRLPGRGGPELLTAARALEAPPEVVLMTAYADVPSAVAALKAGAYDYLAKPFEPDELLRVVQRAAERGRLVRRAQDLEAALTSGQSGYLGVSAASQEVRRLVERVGPRPVPVLLTGETGTGKEVVARELHRAWGQGELVALNCGAIPEALLEAELFGVARGAFTGAHADRPGLLEQARGGTLLLDEVGELPLPLQVKLNRVLEEGEYRRVGESTTRQAQARVVCATHRDLEAMVAEGRFRQDLYYRLRIVHIHLPPLRQRREDLPLLAARFLHQAMARYGGSARRFSPDALALLECAPWPGNARELRNAVEQAAVLCEGDTIDAGLLGRGLVGPGAAASPGTWRAAQERAVEAAAREYFPALVRAQGGNITRAAEEAGVERETLHRLLRRYGVDPTRYRS